MLRDKLITAPVVEPVSVAEQKIHSRIDGSASGDTAYITSLIKTARNKAESLTNQVFITQTWRMYLSDFSNEVTLPRNPVQSVVSIKYIDAAGVEQTLDPSTYELDEVSVPARIVPAYGQSFPAVKPVLNAVTIEYVAGYGDKGTDVPDDIRHAIKLLTAHYYEHREAFESGTLNEIPMGIQHLLLGYRVV